MRLPPLRRPQGRATHDAALQAFRQSAEVRALLLPLKSGANGINLVEATHVIIAEPLLERAVEQQAIGRVHRMSQTRPTVVHRFVMADTIEENILGLHTAAAPEAAGGEGEGGGDDAMGAAASFSTAASAAGGGGAGSSPTRGLGSPSKRARRAAEESKFLSWETVQALGLSSIDLVAEAEASGSGGVL